MANPKTNKEKLLEKYGVIGKYAKSSTNSQGKQKTSASPKQNEEKVKAVGGNSTKEKLLAKYGVTGKYASTQQAEKAKSSESTKKYTDFNTETTNAYTTAKSKLNTTTTIPSKLSEEERQKRIKEIQTELYTLSQARNGFTRAGLYGNVDKMLEENETRRSQLTSELRDLERAGAVTGVDMLHWEIEDAKRNVSSIQQQVDAFGKRPSADDAEKWRETNSKLNNAKKELNTLEREKTLYDDISKFGDVVNEENGNWFNDFDSQWRANYRYADLTRDADKAMSIYLSNPTEENKQIAYAYDAFAKEYAKNNEKALDDEGVVASWLTKSAAGYLPQFKDQILPEVIGGGAGLILGSAVGAPNVGMSIGAGIGTFTQMYDVMRGSVYRTLLAEGVDEETAREAAEDEALISSLIESGETAVSWLFAGGTKALGAIGNAAKASVAKGSTNVATKFVAGLAGKATNQAASKAANAVTRPLWKTGVRIAGGIVGNGLTEYAEEFTQGAVSIANREQALATVEEEIGQYGRGNINLYDRPIYKNEDGTISTVDSITVQIDDKFVVLPSIVRDENGNAKRLETTEDIVAHYVKTGEYLGEFDTLEEANGYATKLHSAQAYYYDDKTVSADDSLWSGGAKVIGSALSGNNPETFSELHAQGSEGFKIGVMFGGASATVNNIVSHYANAKTVKIQNELVDTVIKDEESLDALIEEGKASGEGTVSEKIATEIETARENGEEVTRDQVKQLIESNKVYIEAEEQINQPDTLEQAARDVVEERNRKSTPIYERLEAQSQNNEPIVVADVKKATGFGEEGSKLVANYSNIEGATFSQVVREVRPSYTAGFQNPDLDIKKVAHTFNSKAQEDAYTAGQKDGMLQALADRERAQNAVVNKKSGFVRQNLPNDVTQTQADIVDLLSKGFGYKSFVTTGLKGNAEIRHDTGEVAIDYNFERKHGKQDVSIVFHAAHEIALHGLLDRAPEEGRAFVYAMYNHLAGDESVLPSTLADDKRSDYSKQNVELSLADAMEEISANNILYLYGNDEGKFYSAMERIINGNDVQAKQGLSKYIEYLKDIIRKIRDFVVGKTGKTKAEGQAALDEVTRLCEMFETAVAKAVENTKAQSKATDTKSTKNLEIKINQEYNGNINHSMKWHTDLSTTQIKQVEKWIRQAGNPEATRITDTANWYKGRIGGRDLFVIYSTEYINNPTILYEVTGRNAVLERNILLDLLEDEENGKSINGKPSFAQRVSQGSWMQNVNNNQNNLGNLGSGQNNQNVGILQGQSQRNGSPAFWSVLENLFSIQEETSNSVKEGLNGSKNYSLKDIDKEYLELAKDPVKNEKRLRELVDEAAAKAGYTDDSSWRMQHTAPNSKDDVSLDKLKESGLIPNDFWEHPEWYTHSYEERESYSKIKEAVERQERYDAEGKMTLGKPAEARIWVYRAVDKTKNKREDYFRNGDWVTPSYDYAVQEGKLNPNGYRIIKHSVSIKDLYWDGNSIAELGYDDGNTYAYADTLNNRKKLDLVTYDYSGGIVPLSKRFNRREANVNFSLKDQDYLKAVESGDMGTAQRMVDEAAEKAFANSKVRGNDGKLKTVYHGRVSDFNIFDRSFASIEGDFGKGYYFTSNEYDVDANYANEEGPDLKNKIARLAERLEWEDEYADLSYGEREEIARQRLVTSEPSVVTAYLNMENPVYITPDENGTLLDYNEEYDEEYDEYGEPEGLLIDFVEALNSIASDYAYNDVDFSFLYEYAYDNGGVYASDAVKTIKHRITDELTDENGDLAVNEVIRLAFEEIGFDGIIDTSVYYKFRNMNGMDSGTTHYIVFNSEQIKSDEPVTYDDKDKVIPLSERFNKQSNDIRYSLKDSEGKTLTEAQREYFKDSKIRDENGNLLVMYQGASEDFTVFDRRKSSYANLYGRGFYFTKSESHASQYGNTRAYYLDIKHPVSTTETTITKSQFRKFLQAVIENEDYSFENYGYGATVESVLQSTYGKSDFLMLNDVSQTAIGDLVEAVELFNEVNSTDYDGIILDTETVIFNSEQAKLTTNKKPTSDPDINFSLKKSVEETKNLIAVHNMQSSELERTLDLGGLPMPSIAIIKAQSGHSEYGDVSLVFDKSVIDPKANKLNKVYGGDAWTPVYPKIEYKPNEKVSKKISDKYYEFSRQFGYDESKPLYSYVYDLEEQLNRNKGEEGLINELYEDTRLMQLYLLDSGKDKVETIQKETRTELTDAEVEMNEFFIKELGADVVDEIKWDGNGTPFAYRKNYISKYEDTIRETYKKLLSEVYRFSDEQVQNVLDSTKAGDYVRFVFDAYKYHQNGRTTVRTEADYEATQQAIREAAGEDYRKWVDSIFKGVEEKSGIRNNTDYFTNSGNRRSWEALHWENNLENVIKVMKSQDNGVAAFFSGQAIWAVSAKDYRSIEEIKADSDRLKKMPEEEYNKIKEGFGERLSEIAHSIMDKSERNPFIASDNAMECIVDAVRNSKTKSGILNRLKQYRQLTVTETTVDDIVALVSDISNMPTEYFEAKPKRAVGLNEIATAIIPDSISKDTKARLDSLGIKYLEYEAGNENARLEALNSLEDVQFSLKGTSNINTKDQKELLDIIEHLKGEFEVTKFAKADPKKLAKMTRDILKEYNSKADFDETYKAIDALYQYMANGEDGHTAVWEDVYSRAYNVAQKIVENALVVDDYMYQTYKSLREYLRSTPIKFDTRHDSVPSSYENYNEFRKMNMGRLKFTNNGMSIDYIYQELAHLYPEFFNAEEQITSEEQFETIINVLDEIRPTEVNPFDRQIEQVSMQLANDLTSRFFDIPQAKPTFADKAERRVVEAHIKGGKKVEAVRQQKNERIKKLLEAQKEKTKKQLDKIREQRDTKVEKEKAKRRDAISKMSESQKAKVLRARITRHASDLSKKLVNPTDNQHIPYELQGVVAKLLDCINLESNYTYDTESHSYKKNDEGLPSKRTQAFYELRDIYKNIASSVVVDPDLVVEGGLLSSVISLADKRIVDMDSSELETVWQTMRAIEASISSANKMFSQGKFATILEYAEKLRQDNAGKKPRVELKAWVGGGIKRLAQLDMLTPETYLHYLGSAGDSIFRMMRDAQDKHISIMKEVADFTHKALKDVDVNSLEKTIHTVKLGGEEVQLTTAQIMELYVLMKREQAVDHIMIGGILPDTTEGKGVKLNVREKAIRNLTMVEITKALSKLTTEQKQIADKLQKFVSTVLSKYGNEASMKVYNYEKFLEKNYWTLRINKKDLSNKEVGDNKKVVTVANKGMAKGTVPHANNSVRIGSIFDTFASHSSDMATYAAWLGTSEDINRIRNFIFYENGARTGSVEDILDTVHGAYASKGSGYLENLLEDIAIGVKGTDNMNPFDKLIGTYKAASVGANLRVIIQQPTAILRAMDMIDAHYLAEGAIKPLKGWEKAKKYAPIAQWKDWGQFDINTGRQMKDVLFDNASLLEKTKQVGMWGASMADSLAWGQLWNAVESETKAKHKELEVGSDAYYETVAKRFTEIVDHTQVVDGILQRSQIMRSPEALTKMATSFMGEPTKQYNMAVSAAYDALNSKGDARKKAVARLGRTAASLAVAGIVNACVQSIIDAMRDDDKEKKYWEKWLDAFIGDEDDAWFQKLGNIGDTFNPLNYVPLVKDVVSILSGYDVKRMDMESISKLTNATVNMYKAVTGTGKYTVAESSAALFAETARLFGLPVANVKRDIKSLVMSIANETDSYLMQYRMEKAMLDINYAGNSKNFMDILFNAYNNDREAYEYIYNDLLKSGYDAEKIQSGMETRMKKAEGVEKASDLSKRYMTPVDEKKYDSSLNRVKSSQAWKSANEEQRKDAEDSLYDFLTSTSEAMEKTRAEARAFGVDETEYTLWQLAKEMVNDSKDSMNAIEKAAAIEMLDLGNSELAYFYNTETADKAYAAGVDIESFAMFKAAVSELKGDNKKALVDKYARKYANTTKDYLFFMGSEYSSYKKRSDYIRYFGK